MPRRAWRDKFYVDAYELAREGLSDCAVAEAIGVDRKTFARWVGEKPPLREALERGRRGRSVKGETKGDTFAEYVYKRLPPALQGLWDEIFAADKEENGVRRIESLLARAGQRARQSIFVHALVHSNFKVSEALRLANLSRTLLDNWIAHDPTFAELMDEIRWHKENFFEGALLDRVAAGDSSVIIFANKTYNKARGYTEKIELNVGGGTNSLLTIDDLTAIPLAVRRQLLEALDDSSTVEPAPASQ